MRERLAAARTAVAWRVRQELAQLRARARSSAAAVAEILPDLVGLGSYVAICYGVFRVFGLGWMFIAAGVPPFIAYVLREAGPVVRFLLRPGGRRPRRK